MTVALDEIELRYPDADEAVAAVRFRSEITKRRAPPEYERDAATGDWVLRMPRPARVARLEYLLEVVDANGASTLTVDPWNPLRAPNPFGEMSVLEFSDYRAPAWLDDDKAPTGMLRRLRIRSRGLRANVRGLLWSPPDTDPREPLPLLVVHDGPEYAEYAGLVRLLESATAELELPALRAALIAPVSGQRNEHYSASARYSSALVQDVLPALERRAPTPGGRAHRIGMGSSLGALAMLHAHRMYSDSFGGLFLQSGSFFRQRLDGYELGFSRFARIARFVGTVQRARTSAAPIPTAMTCGTGEENLANNRALRDALAAQGYPAELDEHPDAHNWISWRDVLDPHLISLLQRLWG